MSDLLNRKAVRCLMLDMLAKSGRTQFTRVSAAYLDELSARVRLLVVGDAHRHPSTGVTIKAMGYT